jgi:transcriptional regulator with XRE-family HTH domain
LNQVELGLRLHYSAMAISRWERGEQEPTDRGYIELGNLAGDPMVFLGTRRSAQ